MEKMTALIMISGFVAFCLLIGFMAWSDSSEKTTIGVACVQSGQHWDGRICSKQ